MNKLFFVLALLVCGIFAQQKDRLLKFGEDEEPIWVSKAEMLAFKDQGIGFMDITDFIGRERVAVPVPPPLPSQPQQKSTVDNLIKQLSVADMEANLRTLSSYKTRFYSTETGVAAAEWIHSTLLAYGNNRKDLSVRFFNSSSTDPQPSVIASISGQQSDDVVILGAHEDSIHLGGVGDAPGADDDGSGTVTLLEVFRVITQSGFKPNRTIEFHFYAAEEVGLKGSEAVAAYFADNRENVVGMMQLDMTLYVGNKPEVIGIITDFVDPGLTQFLRELVSAYSVLTWANTKCGYGCSDHASWNAEGYRSCFPFETLFENHNPYIHTAKDTLNYVDFSHGVEFAKVGLGFLVELAATVYE